MKTYFSDRISKMSKLSSESQVRVLWNWAKAGDITKSEFIELAKLINWSSVK